MALTPLYQGFRVWEYSERTIFEPLDRDGKCLVVDRSSGSMREGAEKPSLPDTTSTPFTACALLGVIDLLAGPYILLVTNRQLVGAFRGAHIFKVVATKIIPPSSANLEKLTPQQKSDEAEYVKRVVSALSAHGLYFSYGTDITTSSQKFFSRAADQTSEPLWKQADPRFFWNRRLLEPLFPNPEAAPFILPVMQGSFQTIRKAVNSTGVQITLIARRSVDRIGTRMWRRGADAAGAVANFVESEQVLESSGQLASFLQVRGSIPIFWEQIVNLKYKPKLKPLPSAGAPLPLHLKRLSSEYGRVLAIDLVNQKGGESKIGREFAAAAEDLKKEGFFKYVPFDFHKICGHTHFDRLSILYDQIKDDFTAHGFFLRNASGATLEEQKGTVRTNCVDCLDRTNVTQSLLARKALDAQMHKMGILESAKKVADHQDLDADYKIMWANHGDDISKQYSGTGALKGDFVRYGKRSPQGLVQDGINSLLRYAFNNFSDGLRQDGLDLVTGHFSVQPLSPSPFLRSELEKLLNFPAALGLFVVAFILSLRSLLQASSGLHNVLLLTFWASIAGGLIFCFKKFGREFCDRPKLCKLL